MPVELDVFKPPPTNRLPRQWAKNPSCVLSENSTNASRSRSISRGLSLWTGLFNFLPDPVLISRLVASGLLLGGAISLLQVTIGLSRGNALLQFLAVGCSIATLVTELLALALLAANCLTILQETAEGGDRVSQWPESSPLEWAVESFSVGMAMFFSGLPGMLVFWATAAAGMSMGTSWIFVGISWYIFFPVALLSILESASLTSPVSKPILDSLRSETLLWVTFYLITFFLALGVAITLTLLTLSNAYPLLFALGIVWAFAAFLYFRLLGRLAWACQVRPTLRQDADENEGHKFGRTTQDLNPRTDSASDLPSLPILWRRKLGEQHPMTLTNHLICMALVWGTQTSAAGENWPQFRGPNGDGHVRGTDLPTAWSETEHIAWKTPIHGRGWSSPVVWGQQIWLTTASDGGHELYVLCLDVATGKVLRDIKLFDVCSGRISI